MNYLENKSGKSVRALTEGALMSSIAALFGIISIYVPILGILTGLIWAMPLILLMMRHNIKTGMMGLMVTGLLIAIITGPVQALLFLANMGGMALVYGYCFKHGVHPLKALLFGTIIAAASMAVTVILSVLIGNMPINQIITEIKRGIDEAFIRYQKSGDINKILPEGVTLEQYKQSMLKMVYSLLPMGFIIGAMGIAFINYLVSHKILKRLKYQVPEIPPFRDWHLPWHIVWGVIVGLGVLVMGNQFHYPLCSLIGKNILYIYCPILFISGLSLVVYFWKNNYLTGFMRIIIIFAAFMFIHVFFIAILIVGLFDPLFDYRRFVRAKKGV